MLARGSPSLPSSSTIDSGAPVVQAPNAGDASRALSSSTSFMRSWRG